MKKYLFNGAMALIVGAFIVSCSHDDIGQTSTVDEMTKSFDEMFKELYGPIAPNHNWGFNTVEVPEELLQLPKLKPQLLVQQHADIIQMQMSG